MLASQSFLNRWRGFHHRENGMPSGITPCLRQS
jgi:hypothetical protein